ncbi:PKD domain-containing protein, partial [Thiorhodococcus mannitoliphagus]
MLKTTLFLELATGRNLRSTSFRAPLTTLLSLVFLSASATAQSADISLEWDSISDDRVAFYEVHWGSESGAYQGRSTATSTSATLAGLEAGATYYIAVRACAEDGTQCSEFSNELSATTPIAQTIAPTANFTESNTSGRVPLTILFSSTSQGRVDSCQWDFGNGQTATGCQAAQTFSEAGRFSVTLTVQGPGGIDVVTKSDLIAAEKPQPITTDPTNPTNPTDPGTDDRTPIDEALPIEFGELSVNHEWQRVDFAKTFADPIV